MVKTSRINKLFRHFINTGVVLVTGMLVFLNTGGNVGLSGDIVDPVKFGVEHINGVDNSFPERLKYMALDADYPVVFGTAVLMGDSSMDGSFLSDAIQLYKTSLDLINLDLVNTLKAVGDKKHYLDDYVDLLTTSLDTQKEYLGRISQNTRLLGAQIDVQTDNTKNLETRILQDFTNLKFVDFPKNLQEYFFPMRTQLLNAVSYNRLYKRLEVGYTKLISATSEYIQEISENRRALEQGIVIVRFANSRLKLVQMRSEWENQNMD